MALLVLSITQVIAAMIGVVAGVVPAAPGQPAQVSEWDVKAAYLTKFPEYVEWPAGALDGAPTFNLCVVADAGFTRLVDHVVQDLKIKDRPIVRRRPESATAARQCQMLFISREELARSDFLLEVLEKKTKGNLTEAEQKMLSQTVHELRMEFVDLTQAISKAIEQGKITPQQVGAMGAGGLGMGAPGASASPGIMTGANRPPAPGAGST